MGCASNDVKPTPKLVHKYKKDDIVYTKPDSLKMRVFYVWPDKLAYTLLHYDYVNNVTPVTKNESELY
jgi:hypothetical protein